MAESERLRAEAVAQLVEFDALDAHVTEGYATPQRHLIHRGRLADREARRLHAVVRFCANHPAVAEAMQSGRIGVDHADTLRLAAAGVPPEIVAADMADLLHAADGVDLAVFANRVTTWQWRRTPEATEEQVEAAFDERALTIQPDVFGGVSGRFRLDPAGAAVVLEALWTEPDSVDGVGPTRTLKQRRADQLVAIADASLCPRAQEDENLSAPRGARRSARAVDVVIDLPTLLGAAFDLDDHRGADGAVDWDSIVSGFSRTGSAPRPVLEQFFCDASFRQLITSGPRIVLDYNAATPSIPRALRRAIQRRDRRCQFDGCDRHWSWCDVHHLVPRHEQGPTNEQNLALVCRFHHTLIHQAGWQLVRERTGRLVTTSP